MDPKTSKQTVLVSGATSGIGEATARAFAAQGTTVFGIGRSRDAVAGAEKRLPGVRWLLADVARPDEVRAAVESLKQSGGRLDVLVNNAGVFFPAPLAAATEEQLERQFATNVLGLVHLTQAALPLLEASGGSVVNVSSAAAGKASPNLSLYAATKAAVESLTRSWALELAPRRVRVNAIAPGPTRTPVFEKAGMSPDAVSALERQLVASLPLGRAADPDEVARWIVELAGASWMTGHVLAFDGGMSLT